MSLITTHNIEGLGAEPVGLTFETIFPRVAYSIPLGRIDEAFGPYGHCRCPFLDEPADLVKVCWSDGSSSWVSHHWASPGREGLARRITIKTLSGTPIITIDRSKEPS